VPPDAEDSRTPRGMTPLQKVAMGLVLTVVDPVVSGYDAVPDLLGWVLVVLGLRDLRHRTAMAAPLTLAVTAGLVSVALVRPGLIMDLPESTGWWLSLPQIAFSFLLCGAVAAILPAHDRLAARFLRLRWGFVVAGAGPVLLYGGGVRVLLVPLSVLTVLANVYLVYLVFRAVPGVDRPAGSSRP
jgi:hypothetical protein